MNRNRRWLQTLGLMLAACLWAGLVAGLTPAPAVAADEPVGEQQEVFVGFYGQTISDVDQFGNSFYTDFFMWLRWTGGSNPLPTLEFANNVETWSIITRKIYDEPQVQADGSKVQVLRVQGRFAHPFDFSAYPIDRHVLTVRIEDTVATEDKLVYLPDTKGIGLDENFKLPGWRISDPRVLVKSHTYGTTFGTTADTDAETYSAASFTIDIERPRSFFVWKLLLPLVIVLSLGLSVMFIHPSLIEVRLGAPATALLTLVFLQDSYSSQLPEVGKLVLLDKIYVLGYAVILGVLLATIVTSYWVRGDEEAAVKRAFRLDHRVAALSVGGFLLGSAVLVLTAR